MYTTYAVDMHTSAKQGSGLGIFLGILGVAALGTTIAVLAIQPNGSTEPSSPASGAVPDPTREAYLQGYAQGKTAGKSDYDDLVLGQRAFVQGLSDATSGRANRAAHLYPPDPHDPAANSVDDRPYAYNEGYTKARSADSGTRAALVAIESARLEGVSDAMAGRPSKYELAA